MYVCSLFPFIGMAKIPIKKKMIVGQTEDKKGLSSILFTVSIRSYFYLSSKKERFKRV